MKTKKQRSDKRSERISIGVFQGRLTPRKDRSIQFFPFDNWQDEFNAARDLGLDEIEFIFDDERFEENPLWSQAGRNRINELIKNSGVKVKHICADYFMASPFFRNEASKISKNIEALAKLIDYAKEIGATNIEIPLVDNSSIKTNAEEKSFVNALKKVLLRAKKAGLTIGLETDLPVDKFVSLIDTFDDPTIVANYDSGNSAALGYRHREEISSLAHRIGNVHIKDRRYGGSTVPLGSGDANLDEVFSSLKEVGYSGSIIIQAARGNDGSEKETVRQYIAFVRKLTVKYLTK